MAPAPKFSTEKQLEMIMEAASECISESSVTDFTMAKIARLAKLSMGSIYKFVQSKEDIVIALACEAFRFKSAVYEQVLNLPLSAPEKILAVSLVAPTKLQRFTFDYDLETYATNEAVIRRASQNWINKMIETSAHCEELFKLTLTNDIIAGELEHVPNLNEVIEEIILSGWSITVGYEQVRHVRQTRQVVDGTDSLMVPLTLNDPVIRSMTRLLNSYPWLNPICEASLPKIDAELKKLELR